jgi:transcription antitermination factor NusG
VRPEFAVRIDADGGPDVPASASNRKMLETTGNTEQDSPSVDLLWFVAHTKPRCEKKLFAHCQREGISATLPCHAAPHKYRGKTVVFQKPLFPGYVFLHCLPRLKAAIRQNDNVANLLEVPDQATLERQLREILQALEAGMEIRLAPAIGEGSRVRIKSGPLRGVEGWVEKRHGMDTVLLRLDFISQAAAVRLGAETLELL